MKLRLKFESFATTSHNLMLGVNRAGMCNLLALIFLSVACVDAFKVGSFAGSSRLGSIHAIKIEDWSKVVSPPLTGIGNRFGPNWTAEPKTLDPININGICGTLTWSIGNSTYIPPERRTDLPVGKWLDERRSLGIAMSGGGLRAATCAVGWLRGLDELGILNQTRYIAANSGGTWTTLPLFSKQILDKKEDDQDMDYDEWLGKYVEPQDIMMGEEELGKMGHVMKRSNAMFGLFTSLCKKLILQLPFGEKIFPPMPYTAWANSIKEMFFDPVMGEDKTDSWLDICNAYMWNQKTQKIEDILNHRNTLPYPIYLSSCSKDIRAHQVFPLEMTPLYVGIPVDPKLLCSDACVGSGFVMGVGFNAHCTDNPSPIPVDPKSHYLKNLDNPSPVVKLFELTGASSNFGASTVALTRTNLFRLLTPQLYGFIKALGIVAPGVYSFWSPDKGGEPGKIELVDGGLLDNLGVLALLRRKCSTLVICNAADSPVKEDSKEWKNKFYDVAALFGEMGSTLPSWARWLEKKEYRDTINARSKVFAKEEFVDLMEKMMEREAKGEPLVVRKTMQVLKNTQAGIFEGFEVDAIWCFNGAVGEWTERLSDAGKEFSKVNPNFPYFSTLNNDYSQDEVNMLAHLSSYQIKKGLKEVVEFDVTKVPMKP